MSHSDQSSSNTPLRRGQACLDCRKRKMKCDGARPYCGPCVRGNRQEDCEYADGPGRTRTELLEDSVALLQARIQELERPAETTPSMTLHDPHASYRNRQPNAGGSTGMNLGTTSRLPSSSPQIHRDFPPQFRGGPSPAPGISSGPFFGAPTFSSQGNTPRLTPYQGRGASAPLPRPAPSWWEAEEPPADIIQLLFNIFLPRGSQFGWFLSTRRFLDSALQPLPLWHPSRPLPVLLSVIYLMGIHFSGSPELAAREPLLLARVQSQLNSASVSGGGNGGVRHHPKRDMHMLQAELILAYYFFRNGRVVEGRYHVNAAVSLAFACKLNKVRSEADVQVAFGIGGLGTGLPPPVDEVEEGERINAFWQVFVLDRVWSAVMGSSAFISDEEMLLTDVDTPWPLERDVYQPGVLSPDRPKSSRTLAKFLNDPASEDTVEGFSITAMVIKSAILYEQATQVANRYKASNSQSDIQSLRGRSRVLITQIEQFIPTLFPLSDDAIAPEVVRCIILSQILARVALIQVYKAFGGRDGEDGRREALRVAEGIAEVLGRVDGTALVFTNPIIGTLLMTVCEVLVVHVKHERARRHSAVAPTARETGLVGSLEGVVGVMSALGTKCPFTRYQLGRVQEMRGGM
ncbi:hypothetical protein JAAARDRAFT_148837 [Jaapia argillacea MUCL 33604]|uniref:Zn(2)-C6 fungal-type domain-containing protein n=1 Tax=Jaapia argillacea MUCL 33604 TaxID=933084 RepID=A0A067QHR6_9AGAM|nr:hypothetical protein JAAARDRAFT_148837 [Jaapia argillacea MUCL 33604]